MTHPTWGYHKTEEPRIFDDGELPQGWYDSPTSVPGVSRETNGAQDTSEPVTADLAGEYEQLFGERPHHRMKAETIRQRIAEKQAHGDGEQNDQSGVQAHP